MRVFKFIAIGCFVGLVGGVLLGTVFSSGTGVVEEAIFQSIFGLIGGGILGSVAHILTRRKGAGETFLPKQGETTAADLSRPVLICMVVGGVLGCAAMMIGNIVFRVVPGGAIGGSIGGTVGGAVGRIVGLAMFSNPKRPPEGS